ncbi:MAG TPA: proline iminopeptidase-family hydrolase [Lacunisphaera sp.]|nr:proline iminopeptidase-family hydrolase [Lacunisphaera sp.]
MKTLTVWLAGLLAGVASFAATSSYHANPGTPDFLSGGVRMIEIQTPKGKFKVWTKRVGHNPRIKVLLLHGGPGATHEYYEACDSWFPGAEIEYYYYDQLGSAYSDQPDEPSLWDLPRFVDEVEQVRLALGLDYDNFYLLGQSWGGMLAMEYALKHQQHLKGLIISNMMSSIPAYNAYAKTTLMPAMPPEVLKQVQAYEAAKDYENPKYMELLMGTYYTEHILRMPLEQWPDPVNRAFGKLNRKVYVPLQGPSEMGSIDCKLMNWDRFADLKQIKVPTLVVGARHDTMDPSHMKAMAGQFPRGRYLYCAHGSHLAIYDDQQTWFEGVIQFIKDVDAGK